MIKIPYGLSDFRTLIKEKFFYQDRTEFIEKLENWNSKFPVFLRPRRFGKSLFISALHYYYGLEHKDQFQELFGKLYIGRHPTAAANNYLILRFDFSRIDTATHESTYEGFLRNVLSGARRFLSVYSDYFPLQLEAVESEKSPEAVVKYIFDCVIQNEVQHKIYLLIDEYDHFANELLSFDMDRFKSDISRNGFVRKFYESLKTAAGEGILDRIFITGVSPVTLDSLTSGFNISDNISLNPVFHNMMGFTHEELKAILRESDIPEQKIPAMTSNLAEWYNGYLFAPDETRSLFNPDMVLYFIKEYRIKNRYPYEMLDVNIVSDYRKIRNIFKIGGPENERFELLEKLVEEGSIQFSLTRLYNLESVFTQDDFLSLLFYMGMLTLKEAKSLRWQFEIPNYVIKKLYFEYFASIFLAKTRFFNTRIPIGDAIEQLVNEAKPEPFFKIVEYVLTENHSNRDEMAYGEKHIKSLMTGLLFQFEAYFIRSEYETAKGYVDLFLEKTPDKPINYEIALELKYVKKSAKKTLNKVVKEAEEQLTRYMASERFSRPDVRGFYVVFFGGTLYQWGEFGKY